MSLSLRTMLQAQELASGFHLSKLGMISLWPVIPLLFGVGKKPDFMFSSHDLCRLNAQRKYSVNFSREPPLSSVGRTLDLVSLQPVNHPFLGQALDFILAHMIQIHQDWCITPFRCGADTGFHVSSHDLNSKISLRKQERTKKRCMFNVS